MLSLTPRRLTSSVYSRLKRHNRFYVGDRTSTQRTVPVKGFSVNMWRRAWLEEKNRVRGTPADEVIDLRDKKNLEMSEAMRSPIERDFYQDHTYHNQWIQRDYDAHQRKQLNIGYGYLVPGFEYSPWLWYPGDVVEVVEGEFAGLRGQILSVVKYRNQITVQNVNVKDITLPASDSRPEQIVQREHPINVDLVRHVDPTTNAVCEVRLITVRNKETGELEKKRLSLASGVLLNIPQQPPSMDGDPQRDTPIQDADEETYVEEEEQPQLVQRKLKAMEDAFVKELEQSYRYHAELSAKNYRSLRAYQGDVVAAAEKIIASQFGVGGPLEAKADILMEALTSFDDEAKKSESDAAALAAASPPSFTVEDLVTAMGEDEMTTRLGLSKGIEHGFDKDSRERVQMARSSPEAFSVA